MQAIEVDVKEGRDLKNTQYIGMQDPYLKIWVTSTRDDKQNTSTYGTIFSIVLI